MTASAHVIECFADSSALTVIVKLVVMKLLVRKHPLAVEMGVFWEELPQSDEVRGS